MEHFMSEKVEFYYTLRYEKRSTFALEMMPDGTITLRAPETVSFGAADRFLTQHAFQINAYLSAVSQKKKENK